MQSRQNDESPPGSTGLPTLRHVLDLPVVRKAVPEVVTGLDRLDRPIRWVHAGEVPHIGRMLKGGELLLTTGMGIGRTEEDRRRFIIELAERGCAAVAIELGTALRQIPSHLIVEANRRDLPLIALHREVRFVDITEVVHREIVGHQLEIAARGEDLHDRFIKLMLDGARVPELLAALAETIANPVVLDRTGVGLLYHATYSAGDAEVLAAWHRFTHELEGAADVVEYVVPPGGTEEWGRLVAFAVDNPLRELDRIAIERARDLIALALMRDREDESVALRERGDLLGGLVEGEIDEAEVRARAADMGFGRDVCEMLAVVVARSSSLAMLPGEEASWARTWREIQRELSARRMTVIAGTREHERQLLMVLALNRGDSRAEAADNLVALVHEKADRHLGSDSAVVVSVGPVAHSWTAIGDGLRTALDALAAARTEGNGGWHDAARPDLDRVLLSLRDRAELRRFAESRLAPLIRQNGRKRANLIQTLAAYCEHAGRKAETARALRIKRQTLYNRLERIEDLLGVSLADGNTLLGLHLALRVMRFGSGYAPDKEGVSAGRAQRRRSRLPSDPSPPRAFRRSAV